MVGKARLEAFSDGVLAIAITLLVIEIQPPAHEPGVSLASALWDQWPSYVAYVVSFMQIGVIWLNHHRIFQTVRAVDGTLLLLNLLLLMCVAFIPFPTAVVADNLQEGGSDASTAMALYGGVMLLTALSFVALYSWITHDERIAGTLPPRRTLRAARLRFSLGLLAYTVAFLLSWVSAPLALALHAAMALYYAFDQASIQTDDAAATLESG
jgi:TMEM175 potassium channel family protein